MIKCTFRPFVVAAEKQIPAGAGIHEYSSKQFWYLFLRDMTECTGHDGTGAGAEHNIEIAAYLIR